MNMARKCRSREFIASAWSAFEVPVDAAGAPVTTERGRAVGVVCRTRALPVSCRGSMRSLPVSPALQATITSVGDRAGIGLMLRSVVGGETIGDQTSREQETPRSLVKSCLPGPCWQAGARVRPETGFALSVVVERRSGPVAVSRSVYRKSVAPRRSVAGAAPGSRDRSAVETVMKCSDLTAGTTQRNEGHRRVNGDFRKRSPLTS